MMQLFFGVLIINGLHMHWGWTVALVLTWGGQKLFRAAWPSLKDGALGFEKDLQQIAADHRLGRFDRDIPPMNR